MTYRVEQFVAKIESPVVAKIGDHSIIFHNGDELASASFCEPLKIHSIYAENDRIIIELVKNDRLNDTYWIGEEQTFFYRGENDTRYSSRCYNSEF